MIKLQSYYKTVIGSSLFRSSGIYTVCSLINASIPFLLLPLFTKKFSTAEFGILSMITTVVGFIFPIISMNLEGAIQRKYYDQKSIRLNEYAGNCYILFSINITAISLLFYVFRNSIAEFTQIPVSWIYCIPLLAGMQFVFSTYLVILQAQMKALAYGLSQIFNSLSNFGLSMLFIIVFEMSWTGRIEAQLISAFIFALLSICYFIKYDLLKITINKEYIRHALKFGVPLIPHALGAMLISSISRIVLTNHSGLESTGLYSVGFQISSILSFLTLSFNNAYVPWLFGKLNLNDTQMKIKIVKLTYAYFLVLLLVGAVLALLLPVLFKHFIFGRFANSIIYCYWLILGFVFQGYYFMVTNYIIYAEKTYLQAVITTAVGLLNIPLTYLLVKFVGPIGAAIAFCSTYFTYFILTWVLSYRTYKMPWFSWNIVKT